MGVDHGRGQIAVSEELLNGADVGAALEQVGGEGMAKGMCADVLREPGTANGHFDGFVNNAGINVMAAGHTRTRVYGQIEKYAGKQWTHHEMRQSIAAVDELLASSAKGGSVGINAANLILLLQGKVYPDYACNEVTGKISRASLAELRHSVRSRVLELTLELEKSIPEAEAIVLGKGDKASASSSAVATQISQQIIYGNFTSISASGEGARINVAIGERDVQSLVEFLKQAGVPETDARELGEIVATEEPENKQEPLGSKARKWFVENLKKAADGTWKIGVSVATDVIKEAVLKYYGLK